MNRIIKTVSVVVVFSMTLSIASCDKKPAEKKAAKIITEDSPWFDSEIIEVDTGVDKDRNVTVYNNSFVGSDDDYYVIYSGGNYASPPEDEIDWNTYDWNDYYYNFVSIVDRNTHQTVRTIDLRKDFTASDIHIDTVSYSDGIITAKTQIKERDYDPLTGELLDTRPSNSNSSEEFSFTDFYKIGEYKIEVITYQMENLRHYSTLDCFSPDGKTASHEFKKPDKSIYIYAVLSLSDTKALVVVATETEKEYYELDLTTGELAKANSKEYGWLDDASIGETIPGKDGMLYYGTGNGIARMNAQTKSIETVFDYSWCDLNRYLLECTDLVECSDDFIILCGKYDLTNVYEGIKADKISLIELTKADKNPHAGKTVMELYDPTGVDAYTSEAISIFNRSNDKFVIEVIDRYQRGDFIDYSVGDEYNDDVWEMERIDGTSALSNKLAIDIINGEGPDILMNTSRYGQLNNPNCLVDLTPYVTDSGNYFTNIIEGSRVEGSIYQLPLSFDIEGIMTKTENAGKSGIGFTLDEYAKLVDKVTNGNDPITFGQSVYFAKLFNTMSDRFISDGKVDLSGPEFKELAEYVRDNVPEDGTSQNEWYQTVTTFSPLPKAVYEEYCTGIGGFYFESTFLTSKSTGITMFGLPSLDGMGPMFNSICSVAVSTQAEDVDACGEFVKILLSEDIQTGIAMNDCFVLNRDAFQKAGRSAIEYYNAGGSITNNGHGSASIGFSFKITQKEVDYVESILLTCSKMDIEDSAVSVILIEEMPAYFLGQKKLDAVIKIAQNRIQKVLNERG